MRYYDLIVVGGGPAGLTAAAKAASNNKKVLLLEKMEKPARKLRITGKGRCNITNTRKGEEFLEKVRCNKDFLRPALNNFTTQDTIELLEKNGLKVIVERGDRVFPASGKAWDVADTLISWAKSQGTEIECNAKVTRIEATKGQISSVTVENPEGRQETIRTQNVIIATGGMSYPRTGSTGDGYDFAYELGHEVVELRPSLVPLEIDPKLTERLKGLMLKNINMTLKIEGTAAGSEFGEAEFYETGLAGATTLRLSRDAVDAIIENKKADIEIDLKPALTKEKITARLTRELSEIQPRSTTRDLLRKMLPKEIVAAVAAQAGVKRDTPTQYITTQDLENLSQTMKNFKIEVKGFRPFEEAIVTAGGVDVSQIDPETMRSYYVAGLYFAGELLDLDANTGGYNLQIAFSTGYLAGQLL